MEHPLVLLDYRLRVVGHVVIGTILASVLAPRPQPWLIWAALGAQSLVWPAHAMSSDRADAGLPGVAEAVHFGETGGGR